MDQDSLLFQCKDFTSHLSKTLQNLQKENEFADVTLVGDDNIQIKAHKVVISACSPILRNLLIKNPHQHPLILY